MTFPAPASKPETSRLPLSQRLRASVLPLWERQREHPFLVALGNGSLPRANFIYYLRQDALFLDVLTKTFAYAIGKTDDQGEMEQFGMYVLQTLLVEANLHRRYGEQYGLTRAEMAATRMAPTNYAYTRHLLTVATTGTLADVLTAILPCAWIYAEAGRYLTGQGSPDADHPYADWLATYASPDFDAVSIWIREHLDARASLLHASEETRLLELFRVSTCYEWLFWEMAWTQETWPQ